MGGSVSKSENQTRSDNNSGFGQDVWGESGGAMQQIYQSLGNLFGQGTSGAAAQNEFGQGFSKNVMDQTIPAWQQQLGGGAYENMGIQESLMNSLNQSNSQPTNMQEVNSSIMGGRGNNFADAMRNQYIDDANRASDNMMANLDARSAASGMSGGARSGVALARGMDDINRNLQRNLAETGYNTFEKDLDRKLGIAGAADQNTLYRQKLMGDILGNKQDAMSGGLSFGQNMVGMGSGQQKLPWEQASMYSGAVGNPVVLGAGFDKGTGRGDAKGFATSGGIGK